jgi:hypothetical protein
MRRALSIIIIVICGIVGGWVGYWIGHLAGWSKNADWPATIGGGTGAILLSIGMAVLFVWLAGLAIFLVPELRARRVLRSGASGEATVVRVEKTGARRRIRGGMERQLACELDVCPEGGSTYRARVTQFVTETVENGLKPGARVTVRVDRAKPTRVAIEEPIVPTGG